MCPFLAISCGIRYHDFNTLCYLCCCSDSISGRDCGYDVTCVCVRVCMCVCVWCMYVCVCVYVLWVCVYMYRCALVSIGVYVWVCMSMYVYTWIHEYMKTWVHARTHLPCPWHRADIGPGLRKHGIEDCMLQRYTQAGVGRYGKGRV